MEYLYKNWQLNYNSYIIIWGCALLRIINKVANTLYKWEGVFNGVIFFDYFKFNSELLFSI